MPLGIDRSDFLIEKSKRLEKDLRTKDGRIASLETENSMLYLKLAQLRSNLQSSREEVSGLQSQYDSETRFRQNVIESAMKFQQELEHIKRKLSALQRAAVDMPIQLQNDIKHANSVMQRHRHLFASQSSSLTTMQDQVSQLQDSLQDVTDRHAKEKKRRQELHNLLMELRGNIRVHCRVRPLMEFDTGGEDTRMLGSSGTKSEVVVHYMDDENVCVRTSKHNKVFEFERVYSPMEVQESVFDEVQPMITSLLDGYNICIMAYGQTGSGKTHTMLGSHTNEDYHLRAEPHKDEGVIPRAARELFRLIEEKQAGSHTVEVSVVEIYNNDIRDLLSGDPNAKHDVITGADGGLNIPTLTSKKVHRIQDVMSFVQYGLRTRRESATMVHEHSSRSHLIVTLTVISQAPSFFAKPQTPTPDQGSENGIPYAVRAALLEHIAKAPPGGRDRRGRSLSLMATPSFQAPQMEQPATTPAVIRTKLQLVDLAGSECVGMSGVTGAALREASHINKSLSALADVLGALAEQSRSHVPYRNSRLTHFLQDSIGGDAKLLVLLCVAPAQRYITETSQCLGFGQRARQVQRGPTKRRLPSSAEKVVTIDIFPLYIDEHAVKTVKCFHPTMGCASSSPKKWAPEQSLKDEMSSQNLMPGTAAFPAMGSQQRISTGSQGSRNKVQLKPGHSLMDWIKLGRSGKDLTGLGGRKIDVSSEELKKHNTENDCWLALRGKVYNVTSYLDFHPGGVDELMRGAGKDATSLFDEIHKWVNAESMLEKCLVGRLKTENPMLKATLMKRASKTSLEAVPNGELAPPTFLTPSTLPQQTPRFDWYQSTKTVSVVVYTKWTDMREELVIIDRDGRSLLVTMHIKQSVFYVHIDLEKDVSDKYQVNVSADSGKVEIMMEKSQPDVQWACIGKHLEKHTLYIPNKDYNPAFRDCTIENIELVTKDTNLYTICLPKGCRLKVPIGHHVHIKHTIEGMEVVRSYTCVLPSLTKESQDTRLDDGTVIYLMIKIYKDGAFTPWLGSLKPGDHISMSSSEGNFNESQLTSSTHLVLLAAGTGFTPMVRLIYKSLVQDNDSTQKVKMLFFNKTEADILWQDQLSALADSNNRFTFTNCLSEAEDTWTGLRGRINQEMMADFLPSLEDGNKLLICACGPTPFTKSVIQYAEELGHKESIHPFLG